MTPCCIRESSDKKKSFLRFWLQSQLCMLWGKGKKAGTSMANNSLNPRRFYLPLCDAVWERVRHNANSRPDLMTRSPVSCPIASTQAELWCSEQRQSSCMFSTALHPAAPAKTRREKERFEGQTELKIFSPNNSSLWRGGKRLGFISFYMSFISLANWLFSDESLAPKALRKEKKKVGIQHLAEIY